MENTSGTAAAAWHASALTDESLPRCVAAGGGVRTAGGTASACSPIESVAAAASVRFEAAPSAAVVASRPLNHSIRAACGCCDGEPPATANPRLAPLCLPGADRSNAVAAMLRSLGDLSQCGRQHPMRDPAGRTHSIHPRRNTGC